MQQCYSVASAQRRSRTTDGGLAQGSGDDGQQSVMHLENGVPVYQDMGMNMQVQPSALLSRPEQDTCMALSFLLWGALLGLCGAECMYTCRVLTLATREPLG